MMKATNLATRFLLLACGLAIVSGAKQAGVSAQTRDCSSLTDAASTSVECYHLSSSTGSQSLRSSAEKNNITLNPDNSLNRRVYDYAIAHLGQQIADGECAFLIHNALVAAGAKTFDSFGPTALNSDYVWGQLVATITPKNTSIQGVQVGDIIQFRDASTYEKITKPDGSWKTRRVEYNHHTSIIGEIDGTRLVLIHQNFGNDPAIKRTVQRSPFDLTSLQSGTLWIYRPTL